MQQALQRSSLVPRGFIVESPYHEGDKAMFWFGLPGASACVRRAERLPDGSIAAIDAA